jgi:hypothetical protein
LTTQKSESNQCCRGWTIVIVSPGRYYENINFKGKNIAVTSTAPEDWSVVEATIIDGSQPANPDKGRFYNSRAYDNSDAGSGRIIFKKTCIKS